MKPTIFTLIFITILTGILFMLPTPQNSSSSEITSEDEKTPNNNNSFKLTNVTVFDGNTWHEDSELLVLEGQIVNNVKNPDQLPIIDGKNGFVIPGLIDAHTHTWGNALQEALSFGVTTELDMFSELSFGQQARLSRDLYKRTSQADFYSAGTLITSTGGHGTKYGFKIPTIDGPEDAEQFVLDRIEEGSDYIKIVYHHKPEYYRLTAISKETLIAVIAATQKHNKLAVVHITDHQSATEAVEAGANGLVHTFGDRIISEDLLEAMKARQVFIIPTLSVIASMAKSKHSLELAADKNLSQRLSSASKNTLKPFANLPKRPLTLANAIKNTRKMYDQGITILAGTDAGNPGTAHGISMHGELELLSQAGLSPTEVLQAAGKLTTERFSLSNRGSLGSGAKADFLMLSADPRIDIKNTRKITSIWKNGFLVEPPKTPKTKEVELPKSGLFSDFNEESLISSFETIFQPTSDQMMQGNSTASVNWTAAACDGGGLHVKGEIKAGFPYAWSGVFLPFSENMDQVLNLKSIRSLEFDVSGDSGTYQLMIFTLNNMQPVQLPFEINEGCNKISFLISDHPVVDWSLVTGMGWVADRNRLKSSLASFAFKLDNVVINHE